MSTVVNFHEENSCILQLGVEADDGIRGNNGVEADDGVRSSHGVEADDGNTSSKISIYRLPVWYKNQNGNDAFNPQVISLGPYHHSDALLEPMQEHKLRAVDRFLERSKTNDKDLTDALKKDIEELKACYDQLRDMDDDNFLKILIEDGCFIIEFLRASAFIAEFNDQMINGHTISDPVFGVKAMKYMSPSIGRDMLLIENQIPLPVLNKLLEEESQREIVGSNDNKIQITGIIDLLWRFYHPNHPLVTASRYQTLMLSSLHILDFYRQSKLLHGNYSGGTVSSAYNLWIHGYKFKMSEFSEFPDSFKDISIQPLNTKILSLRDCFFQFILIFLGHKFPSRVICLPSLSIDEATESTLLNLMAFEMFHTGIGYEVISFILFMNSLVRSEKDVKVLSWFDKRFVFNEHWSELDVAQFFLKLTRGIPLQVARSTVKTNDALYVKEPMKFWFFEYLNHSFDYKLVNYLLATIGLVYVFIQTFFTVTSSNRGGDSN